MEEHIIMDRKTFLQELVQFLKKKLGKEMEVDIIDVVKVNDTKFPAVAVRGKDMIGRSFHGNELYKYYQKGMAVEEVADNLIAFARQDADTAAKLKIDHKMITDIICDYPHMKEKNLTIRLVNYAANESYLKNACYIRYLDLAVVFYAVISREEDTLATALITETIFDTWGITKEQLLVDTLEMMQKEFPAEVTTMYDILKKHMRECAADPFAKQMNAPEIDLEEIEYSKSFLMATIKGNINGAAVLLYPGFLKSIAEKLGAKELNIIPSSIHELLLLPMDEKTKRNYILDMIAEVNREEVQPEEKLSDSLYIYDLETDSVRVWEEKE